MTEGEKMIWAAAFVAAAGDIRRERVLNEVLPSPDSYQEWERKKLFRAAENASDMVKMARKIATTSDDLSRHGFGVDKMLDEMFESSEFDVDPEDDPATADLLRSVVTIIVPPTSPYSTRLWPNSIYQDLKVAFPDLSIDIVYGKKQEIRYSGMPVSETLKRTFARLFEQALGRADVALEKEPVDVD